MFFFLFMQRYLHHVKKHDQVMLELEDATKNYKDFEVAYKEFEVFVTLSVAYINFSFSFSLPRLLFVLCPNDNYRLFDAVPANMTLRGRFVGGT